MKGSTHPNLVCFNDMIGVAYKNEKRMLDTVINALSKKKRFETLHTYLKAKETLIKEKGLNFTVESKVLAQDEIKFLKEDLFNIGIPEKFTFKQYKQEGTFRWEDLITEISDRQKAISGFKSRLKSITSKRVKAVYSPYKSKAEKRKAQKRPVEDLIGEILGEDVFYDNFNPTDVFRISKRNLRTYRFSMLDQQGFIERRNEIVEQSMKAVEDLPISMRDDVLSIYGNFIKYLREYNNL